MRTRAAALALSALTLLSAGYVFVYSFVMQVFVGGPSVASVECSLDQAPGVEKQNQNQALFVNCGGFYE